MEDGKYTLEKTLADPKAVKKLARFLKATAKGWNYAAAHSAEAVAVIMANDTTGAQTKNH